MDRAALRAQVAEARVGRLGTVDAAGRPHLVPVCFVLHGDTVYSAVDAKPKRSRRLRRLDNIRANPVATLLVDHYEEDWSRLWWARLRGGARVLESGGERDEALGLLQQKYEQYRRQAPPGAVIAIAVEDWAGWSAGRW